MNRRILGFYTDRKGRRRPITSRKKTRPIYKVNNERERLFTNIVLRPILRQSLELYVAYLIAAALYDAYKQGSLKSLNIIREAALSSAQEKIVWATLQPYIPAELHNVAKHLLVSIVNRITSEEIKLADQYLQSSSGKTGGG